MILRAYSPSDDDFVEYAFTDKRTRASSKPDEPVSKKSSSKPSKPLGSSNREDPKPVLSEDLKPGLNLRQNLQADEDKFPMVKIKKFPGPLYDIVNEITMDQKWAVSSLGFTSLIDFGLNVMPRRLGYWLLQRFDAKSGILTVFGETIKIDAERVHHTFGFPMGKCE
ncbi:ulp1 protease family, C-terminal catalytic domain-containing protein [Artemisia annua]|uniref:Ulp1 protease family, C-terminal catalytic domain-containing protein n=1 Tax=Artemisia annua TaxID=35608 RepID=A0A2U1P1Q3_ARTAN|nr:ulp1 protease family, C-terminal catalytic domain-containing protein [Artemisia annua]